ncbi:XRE family transcriptional regulator [Clostridium tetani]|uniref:helix-turn-helix domain-containing protein n=1 Tax=Clostridium tetani TaxID=1513 RepID=UPI00100BB95C|nr:helix-turn-helix transcriptional regulator [Clostridium tetani]RXI57266.1 XRE family transcriptional regulator [Clostridium tetani]
MKNRIRKLRKSKGLSQKDFGESINLSQNHVSSLEKGMRSITIRTVDDICRVYGVNKEWLVDGTGEMYSDVLEKFEINDPEVEEFTRMFLELDDGAKKIITELMKKALKEEKESD